MILYNGPSDGHPTATPAQISLSMSNGSNEEEKGNVEGDELGENEVRAGPGGWSQLMSHDCP